jgi:Uma2 family endonuclease
MQGLRIAAPDDESVVDLETIQGLWTEEQYLRLTDHSRRLIEFSNGRLELLPMPTERHQAMLEVLFLAVRDFIEPLGGKARFAPMRLRIRAERFREPDLLVLRDAHDPRRQNRYWLGADVVMEIVSPDDPGRDTRDKRAEYAEAGIPEYWIVDPDDETITVLTLQGGHYIEHGRFRRGERATSAVLAGFSVSVDDVLDAT